MRLLAAGAAATVVVGFVVGFALGGRSSEPSVGVTASGPASSSTAAPATTDGPTTATSEAPASTSTSTSTSSTATSAPSTTASVTTTEVPPTTASAEPFPTIPTTVAPPTTAAPTYAPSRVVVGYAVDASGRLPIPRRGSTNLVITNEGGLAQQWLVTGSGFTIIGATQGTLGAGQSVTVSLAAPPGELPTGEISGIVSVLGAVNPSVAFVIPRA